MCLNFRGEASEADMAAFVRNIGAIVYGFVFFVARYTPVNINSPFALTGYFSSIT